MSDQLNLWFDGDDYNHKRDSERLTGQLLRIFEVVKDGKWRTLKEIALLTGDPEASISAQLRHLRKPRFGSHEVEKEYVDKGLYKYRVLLNGDNL
jgi:hypothetical protein